MFATCKILWKDVGYTIVLSVVSPSRAAAPPKNNLMLYNTPCRNTRTNYLTERLPRLGNLCSSLTKRGNAACAYPFSGKYFQQLTGHLARIAEVVARPVFVIDFWAQTFCWASLAQHCPRLARVVLRGTDRAGYGLLNCQKTYRVRIG
jgi:hypothetical protein